MKLTIYVDTSFQSRTGIAQTGAVWFKRKKKYTFSSPICEEFNNNEAELNGVCASIFNLCHESLEGVTNIHVVNDNMIAISLLNSYKEMSKETAKRNPMLHLLKVYLDDMGISMKATYDSRQNKLLKEADKLSKLWRKRGTRSKKV